MSSYASECHAGPLRSGNTTKPYTQRIVQLLFSNNLSVVVLEWYWRLTIETDDGEAVLGGRCIGIVWDQ